MIADTSIVLASRSARRETLLKNAGIPFEVFFPDASEELEEDESATSACTRLAERKAESVACRCPQNLVLGADTVVCLEDQILGKPASQVGAADMLDRLSGRKHRVVTGVSLQHRDAVFYHSWYTVTDVYFKRLSDADIQRYLSEVYTLDKAGAYAIQEKGDMLVDEIDGLRSNVIGLPIEEVVACLQKNGYVNAGQQ